MLSGVSTCQVSPVLVGRADYLARLDEGLADARLGEPTAVLIGGEAGVGKSRLVSEFSARTAGQARALTGGCLELGASGLPFAPFTGLLRQLVRELGLAGVAELLSGPGRRELARLLPELGELGEPASHDDEAYQGEARARLFEQMLTLFERLAQTGPLVLIIEDAHWADRSTRDLLTYLIGNQQVMRGVLIVVTFRSDELHRGHPLRPLLAELSRIGWVQRLEVPRLTRSEATAQIAAILARDPEPAQADTVFRRSEGNPMFVEQLLCFDGELPESLRDLVLANVQRLPDETRELLRVASAGGVRIGHQLLAAVSAAGEDDLLRALRPAVAGNVLLADEGGYQFRHALICEAMHDDLLPGEHSRLHARYAEAISADAELVPTGRAAIEVAHHWYSAHDVTWALISAWEAAAQAGEALAYAEQLDMLSRVLELWDSVPDAATRIGADHVRVVEEAIAITHLTGDDDRGIGLATAALRELEAGAEAGPGRTALLLEQRGLLRCVQDPEIGVADLRRALELVSGGAYERERGRVLASLAYMLKKTADAEQAGPAAEEALDIARRTDDLATQASALLTLAMLGYESGGGGHQAALDMLTEARAAASQAGDYHLMMNAIINESHLLEGMGEHARAAEVARVGLAESRRYGLIRTSEAVLAVNQAEPLAALGRWDEAGKVIVAALGSGSIRVSRSSLWQLAGNLALARGDLDKARDNEAVAVELLGGVAYRDQHHLPVAGLQIELRAAEGRLGAALDAAQDAFSRYDLQASPRYAWPVLVAGAAAASEVLTRPAAARADGEADRAAALIGALRAAAATLEVTGPVQAALRLTFQAEDARCQAAEAAVSVPLWRSAATAWEALGEPYPQARALFGLAEAALGGGADRDEASSALQRSAGLARGLGAAPLLADISLLARRARIPLDAGDAGGAAAAAEGDPRLGLTQREFEVLRLVAAGMSNAAIAGELFISAKTVSVHVSNILGKLGTASRGEAAALAHRMRLFDGSPAA
jgi:DNA-binding CsgD family transcriptional regulator/tetratricopeptide (TPR) repeat protein